MPLTVDSILRAISHNSFDHLWCKKSDADLVAEKIDKELMSLQEERKLRIHWEQLANQYFDQLTELRARSEV